MANKILLIEDDPFISDMYATKFNSGGFEVTVAENGKVGLETLESMEPSIILLDIVMPKMDGFETLEKIRKIKDKKDIPVILLTNLGQKEDIDKGMELGATDYIVKAHFTPQEVIDKIKTILD